MRVDDVARNVLQAQPREVVREERHTLPDGLA